MNTCRICKKSISGRSDKQFCSTKCRSFYHNSLKKVTQSATAAVDTILHRNRSILLEIMGKNAHQKTVPLSVLEKKKFSFNHCTGIYENAKGKRYYNVARVAMR